MTNGPIPGSRRPAALRCEQLEERCVPAGFENTVLGGLTATFTGGPTNDALVIDSAGGLLRHNRFTAGDAGFASNFDFNPAVPGDQTLSAADPAVVIVVNGGQGNDTVTLGSPASPAVGLAAAIRFNGQNDTDRLVIDNTGDATGRAIRVLGRLDGIGVVSGLGGQISYTGLEVMTLNAGTGNDAVTVEGMQPAATSITTGAGDDTVAFLDRATLSGGTLDGGPGVNTLDYSAYTVSVAVNLSAELPSATGTVGIAGFDNATGGAYNDTLIGNVNSNVLRGWLGNDLIIGAAGADQLFGDFGDDEFIWNNGDGSDVIEGGLGTDTVTVNGAPAAGNQFLVQPNPANPARVRFDRTNLGLFNLDIGTAEKLLVNGGAGNDTFTVAALTGVANLATVELAGHAGADVFAVTPSSAAGIIVRGGPGPLEPLTGDVLALNLAGVTGSHVTQTVAGAGTFTFTNAQPVTFTGIGTLQPTPTLGLFAVAPTVNRPPQVRVFNADGSVRFNIIAYTPGFMGGVRVALGDITGDGIADIITAPGAGGGPHVKVFDGVTGKLVREFQAYNPGFRGGVFVAAGDVTGDGRADIITAPGVGGGPNVRAFDGVTGALVRDFMAYDPGFTGGVSVAAGDVNADGFADIITGAGPGGTPHVKAFSGATLATLHSFQAFDPGFRGGVFVAAGDVDGDGRADIITGAGPGGGPHVRVVSGATGATLASFLAYDAGFTSGVVVSARDVNGDGRADIITAPANGSTTGSQVRVFSGANPAVQLQSLSAFDAAFLGGVFVG